MTKQGNEKIKVVTGFRIWSAGRNQINHHSLLFFNTFYGLFVVSGFHSNLPT